MDARKKYILSGCLGMLLITFGTGVLISTLLKTGSTTEILGAAMLFLITLFWVSNVLVRLAPVIVVLLAFLLSLIDIQLVRMGNELELLGVVFIFYVTFSSLNVFFRRGLPPPKQP